ncbi:MAG: hypothetical protein FJW27_16050 [Acidimicrobiia bacterium]|nr:hypothetical protein [Acidimicrobiia bacterium]
MRTSSRSTGGQWVAFALALAGACVVVIEASATARDSSLIDAVRAGDKAVVRSLLERRADVNQPSVDGTTPLHWAVRAGDDELVRLLLDANANVKATNRYGVTPLWLACLNGQGPIVRRLLSAGADPNTTSTEGETVLMVAARTGVLDVVSALLDRGAIVEARERWRGQTALMWAAAEGHADVVRALLTRGADITARSKGGFTPLLFAVREGRLAAARSLLEAGAYVHDTLPAPHKPEDSREKTWPQTGVNALLLAVGNAHYEVAAFLLDKGADPNAAPLGWTALHQLTWARKTGIAGSNNPPPQGSGAMTSLEFARTLVAKGADLNARVTRRPPVGVTGLNMTGGTPFLLAARTADAPYMRLLAELGADPKLPNVDQSTPLMVAAGLGTAAPGEDPGTEPEVLEAVKLALELGNDINAKDIRGNTAMHGAATKHVPSVVRHLAQAGANMEVWNQGNADGRTPLSITQGVVSGMNIVRSAITEAAVREVMGAAARP